MTPAIELRELRKEYARGGLLARRRVQAVRGVSLTVARGETLGIVGESGCGKSTLGRCLVGAEAPSAGEVRIDGVPVAAGRNRLAMARRAQMVFQDPYSSLNPRIPVGAAIAEVLRVHGLAGDARGRAARVEELLGLVGLPASARGSLPHAFSGGQRQRLSIARALAAEPGIIIADEPVSALDVSVQAQVLNLLAALRERLGLTYVFISHDLHVVRHISHRVAVMYLGQIVELAPVASVFATPHHPYTQMLLAAAPEPDPSRTTLASPVLGEPPDPAAPPSGCAFRTRCPRATALCAERNPEPRRIGEAVIRCHHAENGKDGGTG